MAGVTEDAEQARLARKRRRRERKRRRILEAAADELLSSGLDGFTIGAVAERADLSKPAVYYYFASRDELLGALLVERFEEETLAIVAAVRDAPDGIAGLEALLRAYVDHYRDDLASFRILQTWSMSAGPQTELLEQQVYPLSWQAMGTLEEKLAEDRRAGRLHPEVTPRRLANLALMLGHGIISIYAGMDAMGGQMRFPIDGMVDEAVATLRRAARSGDR